MSPDTDLSHHQQVLEQFTRQALPFSEAPSMRAIDLLVRAADPKPGDLSLDVACGPGLVAIAFACSLRHATGLDATPAMLERARALQAKAGLTNLSWALGDANALPFVNERFDIVTCRFALHHLEWPLLAVKEMLRVCKPGGTVVVCDAVASHDPAQAAAFNAMERMRDPSTVRFLTEAELLSLVSHAGATVRSVTRYRVPAELEGLMQTSFPAPGGEERVRSMIRASVNGDTLGLDTQLVGEQVRFSYPALVVALRKG